MKGLIIFLAVSTLIAAIPLEGRPSSSEGSILNGNICAVETPCAWAIYKAGTEVVDVNITNSYCKCGAGTSCQSFWKDGDSTEYRCKKVET